VLNQAMRRLFVNREQTFLRIEFNRCDGLALPISVPREDAALIKVHGLNSRFWFLFSIAVLSHKSYALDMLGHGLTDKAAEELLRHCRSCGQELHVPS
jgi:pimeloyl-ACP methyl ester carboxylesterase